MIDRQEYERYSAPLAEQMRRIALMGPQFLEAVRAAQSSGSPAPLISDAVALAQELSGKPGDGALEVYRDLDSNLKSTCGFIDRWQSIPDPDTQDVVRSARDVQRELEQMRLLVSSTPPRVMAEVKRTLTGAFGTEQQRHGFRGSNAVMLIVFLGVLSLRYFGVIALSWWIVWPLGIGAAVVVAGLIATIIHDRR